MCRSTSKCTSKHAQLSKTVLLCIWQLLPSHRCLLDCLPDYLLLQGCLPSQSIPPIILSLSWVVSLLCCHRGLRHRAQVAAMQQQDKSSSPESRSTVSTPSPASPKGQGGSSGDAVPRCLPSPLAQLAGQDHPQSGDADDVRSHAAQLASTSKDSSSDSAAQKGMLFWALPCFALSWPYPVLLLCLLLPLPLSLPS